MIPTNFRDFKIREAKQKSEILSNAINDTKFEYRKAIRKKIRNESMPEFRFRSWEMNQAVYKIEKTLLNLGLTSDEINTLNDNYTTDAYITLNISKRLEESLVLENTLIRELSQIGTPFPKKKSWFKRLLGIIE